MHFGRCISHFTNANCIQNRSTSGVQSFVVARYLSSITNSQLRISVKHKESFRFFCLPRAKQLLSQFLLWSRVTFSSCFLKSRRTVLESPEITPLVGLCETGEPVRQGIGVSNSSVWLGASQELDINLLVSV